jgi:PrtD family type I secretion system ABC transporter
MGLQNMDRTQAGSSEIRVAVRRSRTAFLGVAVFSALINVLALTSSIYMLQLYDRVIPSHSVPTLIALTVLMVLLYAAYGLLDSIRLRIMSRIGLRIERELRDRVFSLVLTMPLRSKSGGDGMTPVRDLDAVRAFLAGAGPIALFDLPWMPFYLAIIYLLHPWLGALATAGALLLVGLTILTEVRSSSPNRSASMASATRQAFGESSRRNAEVVQALGMAPHIATLWSAHTERYLTQKIGSTDVTTRYGTLSKVLRMVLQSAVLGLGAYLVVIGQATGGVMIAASILTARALAPIEIAIANWRGFLTARQSAARLTKQLEALPANADRLTLPKPTETFSAEGLWIAAPGEQKVIVQNASFSLNAGQGLGIIGLSASGKSTLARALVGAWLPLRGLIKLDSAALDQWSPKELGANLGYLPQDVELFDGSVAQNIARFDPNAEATTIISAAKHAGVHELILGLSDGYETRIGEGGAALSAGQRQRVALARALYNDPFLVVLDEPNSNLDSDGDIALTRAIHSIRDRQGIVIVIAHRPSVLAAVDQVLVMAAGQVQAFGPKDEVLRKVVQMPSAASSPTSKLKVITGESREQATE